MTSIATDLRQFISDNFLFGADVAFSDDDSLLGAGIIDSTGVLELIAHLEGEYGMTIGDTELVPENLDSISNLVGFIETKRGAVAAS